MPRGARLGPVPTSAHPSPRPVLLHFLVTRRPLPNRTRFGPALSQAFHQESEVIAQGHCKRKSFTKYVSHRQLPYASSSGTFESTVVKLAGWDLSVLQISLFLVAGGSSGKDKRMGGNGQHSALKQAVYGTPSMYSTAPATGYESAAHASACESQENCSVFCKQ